MNISEFMTEIFKILLDKIREQGFNILLLMGVSCFLYFKGEETERKLSNEIKELRSGLFACETERTKIAIDLAALKATFEARQVKAVSKR